VLFQVLFTTTCDRLERTLRLPRNGAADGTDPDTVHASELALAEEYGLHRSNAQTAAFRCTPLVRDQAIAAFGQAYALHNDLEQLNAVTFFDQFITRACREPRIGLCDAIFVTPVPLGTGKSQGELKAREYLKEFGLIQSPEFTPPAEKGANARSESSSSPPLGSLSLQQNKLLRNPLCVSCTRSRSAPALSIPENHFLFDSDYILLGGFVAEYKKLNCNEAKALNRECMYLVALVMFLDVLGIRGFPVFGLIISGQTGGILMVWVEEVCMVVIISLLHLSFYLQKIYIIECNIRTFNLSSPIEVFQFATFLICLREHTDTLKDLFKQKKGEFLRRAEKGELPEWTKEAQVKEIHPL
jgi:hypothetical protein